jgi:hypothetical protein
MSPSFNPSTYNVVNVGGGLLTKLAKDPSVSKTNKLHIDIFQFFFAKYKNILQIIANE